MKYMRSVCFLLLFPLGLSAQDFGLSFSYFVPRQGEFSTPVSPFSLRGVGMEFNRHFAFETGASLYRMTALNIRDLPFESEKSLAGPNLTILVPLELVFRLSGKNSEFNLKGGGFGYHGFFQRLNDGNFDRALRNYEGWSLANGDLSAKAKPGYGWMAGAEWRFDVTRQWGLSFEVNYLAGQSGLPVKGIYSGMASDGVLQNREADFKKAKLDLTGLEFSIGIMMSGR